MPSDAARVLGRPARSSRGLEARRGLRRSRGLVERREACGCIAEASEAVRSAEAPPKKTARSSICHPNHLINKTDLSGASWCA